LGIELWDHVQNVLTAMKEISQELGLWTQSMNYD
jgi:predicted hydrolase (HD superfamily)